MSDIISQKSVTTHKPHTCQGCAIQYPAGTKMDTVSFSDMGKIHTHYWCEACNEYWNRNMENGDEIIFGELRSEDPEGWEAIKKELMS